MYSSFGRGVFECSDSNSIAICVNELVSKLRDRKSPDSEFDAGFEQIIYTKLHSGQKSLVQYILKKVAMHEGQPYIGETDDLTIEHLLAQSTAKNGTREMTIGQIGNLLLVDAKTNEMLSTNDFSYKKEILLDRGYKLPAVLLEADALTDEVVAANTARISELSREIIWKV